MAVMKGLSHGHVALCLPGLGPISLPFPQFCRKAFKILVADSLCLYSESHLDGPASPPVSFQPLHRMNYCQSAVRLGGSELWILITRSWSYSVINEQLMWGQNKIVFPNLSSDQIFLVLNTQKVHQALNLVWPCRTWESWRVQVGKAAKEDISPVLQHGIGCTGGEPWGDAALGDGWDTVRHPKGAGSPPHYAIAKQPWKQCGPLSTKSFFIKNNICLLGISFSVSLLLNKLLWFQEPVMHFSAPLAGKSIYFLCPKVIRTKLQPPWKCLPVHMRLALPGQRLCK